MGTSKDILIDEIYKQKLKVNFYRRKSYKFETGFYMLMEYFDSISEEEKPALSKRLQKIGL